MTSEQSLATSALAGEAPVRLLARICSEYFLDMAANLADAFGGDLVRGLVFLAILRANVENIDQGSETARRHAAIDSPLPDAVRTPVTIYSVAKALGLTYETGRRHVKGLIEQGLCVRTDDGLMITQDILMLPPLVRGNLRNIAIFRTFMATLERAGLKDFR